MNGIYIGTTLFSKVRFAQLFKKAHLILLFLALISQGLVGMNEASAEQMNYKASLMQSLTDVQQYGFAVQPSKPIRNLLERCNQICKTDQYGLTKVLKLEGCLSALRDQLATESASQDFVNEVYQALEYARFEAHRLYIHPLSQVHFVGSSPTRISEDQLQKLYDIDQVVASIPSTDQESNHSDQNGLDNQRVDNCDEGVSVQ